jgi:hypothetical protein
MLREFRPKVLFQYTKYHNISSNTFLRDWIHSPEKAPPYNTTNTHCTMKETSSCLTIITMRRGRENEDDDDENKKKRTSSSSSGRLMRFPHHYHRKPVVPARSLLLIVHIVLFLASYSTALLIPDPVIHFSVGAVAGGAGAVAAYPFDYIKSQMQTEYGRQTYENGVDCFTTTLASNNNNVFGLYKGVGVQVLGIAPEKGIKLGVNDLLQAACTAHFGGVFVPLWAQVVSGGVAGACQVVASSPLEVLKVGLQTSDMTLGQVWRQVGGVSGLFRGAEACILRDVLFTAILFPMYAAMVHAEVPGK